MNLRKPVTGKRAPISMPMARKMLAAKPEEKKVPSEFASAAKQMYLLRKEKARIEKELEALRDTIVSGLKSSGKKSAAGDTELTVDGVKAKLVKKRSIVFSDDAEETLHSLGIYSECIVQSLSMEKVNNLYSEGKISDEDYNSLLAEKHSEALYIEAANDKDN